MSLNPHIVLLWYISNKTSTVLEFICNNKDNPQYVWAVLDALALEPEKSMQKKTQIGLEPPGTSYDIYRKLIAGVPQPVPELKFYPAKIQEQFRTHDCWIGWAGLFDRKLTQKDRVMLSYYREAFLCLLVNGMEQEAYGIMGLAAQPIDIPDQLTGEIMYSKEVLRANLILSRKLEI